MRGFGHHDSNLVRRRCLWALAALALGGQACVPEPSDAPRQRGVSHAAPSVDGPRLVSRPVLIPLDGAADVRLVAAPSEQPVAYVSMATRQLFVDLEYRDQVYWDLRAHISVSTGVWRIPLVEDPPRYPITPGDEVREFEELTMRDWDPLAEPTEGDIRVMRGGAVPTRIDFGCAPQAGGGAWFHAGPWDVLQAGMPTEALTREDFVAVGTATRFSDRDCTQRTGPARVLTWLALPQFLPEER